MTNLVREIEKYWKIRSLIKTVENSADELIELITFGTWDVSEEELTKSGEIAAAMEEAEGKISEMADCTFERIIDSMLEEDIIDTAKTLGILDPGSLFVLAGSLHEGDLWVSVRDRYNEFIEYVTSEEKEEMTSCDKTLAFLSIVEETADEIVEEEGYVCPEHPSQEAPLTWTVLDGSEPS